MGRRNNKSGGRAAATEEDRWLAWVESRFREIAGANEQIDQDAFKTALNLKQQSSSFFADRLFALFDQDNSKTVELHELMDGLKKLTQGTPEEKLKFLFDVYDVDGSGTIDKEELKTVLQSCMEESSLQLTDDDLDSLTIALFESADEDNSGEVTFEELLGELKRHTGILENLTISAVQWLTPPRSSKSKSRFPCTRFFTKRYFDNNKSKVVFYIIYTLINIGLFILSAVRYRKSNGFIIVARGCGMELNFNCAFIVVMMLRTCLTWLRTTRAAPYFPLDHAISIHKNVGIVICVQSLVHTIAHLGNLHVLTHPPPELIDTSPNATKPLAYWELLFTLRGGLGWIGPGFAFLSGDVLAVILIIMAICSMPFVRRTGHFQVFYWTHTLYVAFWVFVILHGPIFWYFFIAPGFIFVCECIARSKLVKLARYGTMYVEYVHILPSKVTHLVISKPDKFRYKPGDYVNIRIPDIAVHEWHPFTISSAPELKGSFWLHIRSAGHWTNKLYEVLEEKLQNNLKKVVSTKQRATGKPPPGSPVKVQGIELQKYDGWSNRSPDHRQRSPVKESAKEGPLKLEIVIDGPYGTPTRDMFNAEHAVLIGSGIGVTPFAAILQSIMFRYQESKVTCPSCDHSWITPGSTKLRIKKVDFLWINRDQRCFEWFVRLLAQLELQQASVLENLDDPFLEMQLFMTAAASRNDMKGLGLQMAMEIMHKQEKRDVITGLQTRTQAGRPEWKKVFKRIRDKNAGRVSVFFCGSPALARDIRECCSEFGFTFQKENF